MRRCQYQYYKLSFLEFQSTFIIKIGCRNLSGLEKSLCIKIFQAVSHHIIIFSNHLCSPPRIVSRINFHNPADTFIRIIFKGTADRDPIPIHISTAFTAEGDFAQCFAWNTYPCQELGRPHWYGWHSGGADAPQK